MKESKFKVGDRVICIDPSNGCQPILGKMCVITRVRESPFIAHSYGYEVMCDNADCNSDKETTYWIVNEHQLEPYILQPTVQECLTDLDVDYEKVSKSPVYFEFVDIGKALNKLKDYEHKHIVSTTYNTPIDMDFHKGETVFFISEVQTICCGLVYSVNTSTVCVEFPTKGTSVYPRHKCFKTYQEAVNALTTV